MPVKLLQDTILRLRNTATVWQIRTALYEYVRNFGNSDSDANHVADCYIEDIRTHPLSSEYPQTIAAWMSLSVQY